MLGFLLPNSLQGSEFLKAVEVSADLGVRNVSTMPAPKKFVSATSNGMPPPPSITMPPPPPPPKFTSSTPTLKGHDKIDIPNKTKSNPVPGMFLTFFLVLFMVLVLVA